MDAETEKCMIWREQIFSVLAADEAASLPSAVRRDTIIETSYMYLANKITILRISLLYFRR